MSCCKFDWPGMMGVLDLLADAGAGVDRRVLGWRDKP